MGNDGDQPHQGRIRQQYYEWSPQQKHGPEPVPKRLGRPQFAGEWTIAQESWDASAPEPQADPSQKMPLESPVSSDCV
ncbi:hypothetical protein NDU88_009343 [Pleurodeles waltl]|uniref:Uncharacterized protein n=1 Tax=Pleurodeles waltl TaxID=8319 RepID=A0AAV7RYS2_PLEWA|nr:hypothetical protein NDU88_009343 [Pleurodeles waltl]